MCDEEKNPVPYKSLFVGYAAFLAAVGILIVWVGVMVKVMSWIF